MSSSLHYTYGIRSVTLPRHRVCVFSPPNTPTSHIYRDDATQTAPRTHAHSTAKAPLAYVFINTRVRCGLLSEFMRPLCLSFSRPFSLSLLPSYSPSFSPLPPAPHSIAASLFLQLGFQWHRFIRGMTLLKSSNLNFFLWHYSAILYGRINRNLYFPRSSSFFQTLEHELAKQLKSTTKICEPRIFDHDLRAFDSSGLLIPSIDRFAIYAERKYSAYPGALKITRSIVQRQECNLDSGENTIRTEIISNERLQRTRFQKIAVLRVPLHPAFDTKNL